jgi:hypothetical protein
MKVLAHDPRVFPRRMGGCQNLKKAEPGLVLVRLTRRCSEPHHHKLLSRGRPSFPRGSLPRARVLIRWRAVAELGS